MEHTLSFEELDPILGNYAPFLSEISDGPNNELRIIISAALVAYFFHVPIFIIPLEEPVEAE